MDKPKVIYGVSEGYSGPSQVVVVAIEKETAKTYVLGRGKSVGAFGYKTHVPKDGGEAFETRDEAISAHLIKRKAEYERAARNAAEALAKYEEAQSLS